MEWLVRVPEQKGADQPIPKLIAFHPPSMYQKVDEEKQHTEPTKLIRTSEYRKSANKIYTQKKKGVITDLQHLKPNKPEIINVCGHQN
jgi:hypothetical protein